jgi:hypothetical protein
MFPFRQRRTSSKLVRESARRRATAYIPPPCREPGDDSDSETAEAAAEAEGKRRGYRFNALTAKDFDRSEFSQQFIVKDVLVKGQPAIAGGPKKSIKTGVMLDLAISAASGLSFLNHCPVYNRQQCVVLSAESSEATLQETARRICVSKGITLPDVEGLFIDTSIPAFGNVDHMAELSRGLERLKADLVILDPLYLSLAAGRTDIDVRNLFSVGPLLLAAGKACLDVGATPVFVAHCRKNLNQPFEPCELEDLAFAGTQEYARQWLLLNRRSPFDFSGTHELWLQTGGSAGHSGLWAVDLNEGQADERLLGRRWQLTISTPGDARATKAGKGDTRKQEAVAAQDKSDDAQILLAVDLLTRPKNRPAAGKRKAPTFPGDPPPACKVITQSKLPRPRGERAIERLLAEEILEEVTVTVHTGRNHKVKRDGTGIRRKPVSDPTVLLSCETVLPQDSQVCED